MEALEQLLQKARAADEDAFEQLCNCLLPLIRGIYYHHFFYELELDDFIQEADCLLISVIQKCHSHHSANFIAYYRKTLNNFSVQVIRHEHRKRVIPYQLRVSDSACKECYESSYLYSFDEYIELQEETVDYLYQLSSLERNVLLDMIAGQSLEELAETYHKESASICRAYQRSRQKYKKIVQ